MLKQTHPIFLSAVLGIGLMAGLGGNMAQAEQPILKQYGRWVVDDPTARFSTNGKLYRVVDIGACGNDFCGVSVGEEQKCGETMFRFLVAHDSINLLTGHGKWGSEKKKLQLMFGLPEALPATLTIGLGDDEFDFDSREGSMPVFEANYHRIGDASCLAAVS